MRSFLIAAHMLFAACMLSCSSTGFEGVSGSAGSKKKPDQDAEDHDAADEGDDDDSETDSAQNSGEDGSDTDSADGQNDDGGDLVADEVVTVKRSKCGTAAEQVLDLQLAFPSTQGQQCQWGQNGNLSQEGGAVRAIRDQAVPIELPDGAVLCSIELNGGSQAVTYDDCLFFTFDSYILASAQYSETEFVQAGMQKDGSLIKFERAKAIGMPFTSEIRDRTNSLCPATGSCQIVKSEEQGALAISAPKSWFDLLPQEVLKKTRYDLTSWVTGQKHDSDCQHSGMSFAAKVRYVP